MTQLLCRIACVQDKSVVIVSHDERIEDIANMILYLEDGKFTKEIKTSRKRRKWSDKLFATD